MLFPFEKYDSMCFMCSRQDGQRRSSSGKAGRRSERRSGLALLAENVFIVPFV